MRSRNLIIVALSLAACRRESKLFCEHNPDQCTTDGSTEGQTCGMCRAPTLVCDTATNTCVECLQNSDCTGTKPVCDVPQTTCRACTAHTDCADGVCLPDGSCPPASMVAYVAKNGIGNCDKATPCAHVADAVATGRPNIMILDILDEHVTLNNVTRTIVGAPNAALSLSISNGSIVDVSGNSTITIADLTIGGTNTLNIGVTLTAGTLTLKHVTIDSCVNGGVVATSGQLFLHQSVVSNNLLGGVEINGTGATFDITNNFIFRNGNDSSSTVGGVRLTAFNNNGNDRLEFNTIVENHIKSLTGGSGGLWCDDNLFTTANNILAHNFVNTDPGLGNANRSGMCNSNSEYSGQNPSNELKFKSLSGPLDYHITTGSVAIDAGGDSMIDYDFDGRHRPVGPKNDQGANEVQ